MQQLLVDENEAQSRLGMRIVRLREVPMEAFLAMVEDTRLHDPVTFQRSYGGASDAPWTELNYRVYRAHMALLEAGATRLERLFLIDELGAVFANGLFRHRLSSRSLREGGHIGYEVPPLRRGRGYGKLFLRLALARAMTKGLTRILITCNEENEGSRRIIESAGGKLENRVVSSEPANEGRIVNRYWFELAA